MKKIADSVAKKIHDFSQESPLELPAYVLEKGFFVNFTVIFRLLRDNPVIQYFQLEHERYRAV